MVENVEKGKGTALKAWDDLREMTLDHNPDDEDSCVVTWKTGALLPGQQIWVIGKLGPWFDSMKKAYPNSNLKLGTRNVHRSFDIEVTFKLAKLCCDGGDAEFHKEIVAFTKKYVEKKIVEEFPLPFKTHYVHIPIIAGHECRYYFGEHGNCSGSPLGEPNQLEALKNTDLQETIFAAIKKEGGESAKIYFKKIRGDRLTVAYLSFKLKETFIPKAEEEGFFWASPLERAVNEILKSLGSPQLCLTPIVEDLK